VSGNRTPWGPKRARTVNLSDPCWEHLGDLADRNGVQYSEVLEIIVRNAAQEGLDLMAARKAVLRQTGG